MKKCVVIFLGIFLLAATHVRPMNNKDLINSINQSKADELEISESAIEEYVMLNPKETEDFIDAFNRDNADFNMPENFIHNLCFTNGKQYLIVESSTIVKTKSEALICRLLAAPFHQILPVNLPLELVNQVMVCEAAPYEKVGAIDKIKMLINKTIGHIEKVIERNNKKIMTIQVLEQIVQFCNSYGLKIMAKLYSQARSEYSKT